MVTIVNLDALIKRADLAAPGEIGEDISSLSVMGLEPKGMLYPALKKPDFQRETAQWSPDQVADLVSTFVNRDLIPAVILWRAGHDVFVIDGAHRLSALIAWVHDDYGDGSVSRHYFQDNIPDEQKRTAAKTRELINETVGSFADHKMAIDYPANARPDIAERAARIGWQEIPAQWIRNADHEKAEKSFFRINQGGTKIDPIERRILSARRSATALAARAIIRGGTGNNYWKAFKEDTRTEIASLGAEIHELLFSPSLSLPIKTLDVPVAGEGYGPRVLPFVFDLVNLANRVVVKDSSYKRSTPIKEFADDPDGAQTIQYLKEARKALWRVCSTHASSLGLHPALYFYGRRGVFQPAALLSYIVLFQDWDTAAFKKFITVREQYEQFTLSNRGISEAIRRLGSGARSRPRIIALFRKIIDDLNSGSTVADMNKTLAADPTFDFFVTAEVVDDLEAVSEAFNRDTKGAAFLKDAIPSAPKCPTCKGLMHRNGMQVGHIKAKRDGGRGALDNAMMQHPFCNSTVAN
jgi:hypothetical protein